MGVTVHIRLSALQANYRSAAARATPAAQAAAVKANAYGLGMVPVAKALYEAGCRRFYTFTFEEAAALRAVLPGDDVRAVFLAGPADAEEVRAAAALRLIPALHSDETLRLHKEGAPGAPYLLHFDTGMSRYGFAWGQAERVAQSLKNAPPPQAVMSHLACADTPEHPLNALQLARFEQVRRAFTGTPASFANSAGLFLDKAFHFQETRAGAALYGIYADPAFTCGVPFQPVARLTGTVLSVTAPHETVNVGYAACGVSGPGRLLATVSGGYADGVPRSAGNGAAGAVTEDGIYCPTVGRVSMDVATLDVTDAGGRVTPGDRLEWFGDRTSVSTFAERCGTIGYEILTGLKGRTRRIYV